MLQVDPKKRISAEQALNGILINFINKKKKFI
jgi:hypothetical protein